MSGSPPLKRTSPTPGGAAQNVATLAGGLDEASPAPGRIAHDVSAARLRLDRASPLAARIAPCQRAAGTRLDCSLPSAFPVPTRESVAERLSDALGGGSGQAQQRDLQREACCKSAAR